MTSVTGARTAERAERARRLGPDQLRGLLLTLVIFGHTYLAGTSGDFSKWVIYGFHMPLFFGVSGWLLTTSGLIRRTLPQLLGYYWRRMIWQWLLVSIAFDWWKGKLPARPKATIDTLFFEPLFHLWFVPALLIMVVITHVALRAGCGWGTLAGIAVVSFVLFELPVGRDWVPESLAGLDKRYGAYFIWFLLGFAVRNAKLPAAFRPSRAVVAGLSGVLVVAGMTEYLASFRGGPWLHDIGFGALNVGLILLLPQMLAALDRPLPLIGDAMTRIGRGSLWVYLLHPFVTEQFRPHDDGGWRGRAEGLALTVVIVAVGTAMSHVMERWRHSREPVESSIDPPLDLADGPAGVTAGVPVAAGFTGFAPASVLDLDAPYDSGPADDARQPRQPR